MTRRFTVYDMPQHLEDGTTANPDWLAARLGRVTGSTADAMLAKGRSKDAESVQRRDLRLKLALERLTGKTLEKKRQTDAMFRGLQLEPEARAVYESVKGVLLDQCGFIAHNDLMAGCSVDGYYGDFEGLVSIKCPEWAAHLGTLRRGEIELGYMRQIVHEQFVTGALWTDFVSYNPDFDGKLQMAIIRVKRQPDAIEQHEVEVRRFLDEVQTEYDALVTLRDGVKAVA
jgi:hypothetical protein